MMMADHTTHREASAPANTLIRWGGLSLSLAHRMGEGQMGFKQAGDYANHVLSRDCGDVESFA